MTYYISILWRLNLFPGQPYVVLEDIHSKPALQQPPNFSKGAPYELLSSLTATQKNKHKENNKTTTRKTQEITNKKGKTTATQKRTPAGFAVPTTCSPWPRRWSAQTGQGRWVLREGVGPPRVKDRDPFKGLLSREV